MQSEIQMNLTTKRTQKSIERMRQMAKPTRTAMSVLEARNLADDADMEQFLRDGEDHRRLTCLTRKCFNSGGHMSKKAFKKWKEKLFELDEDKPLKDVI